MGAMGERMWDVMEERRGLVGGDGGEEGVVGK